MKYLLTILIGCLLTLGSYAQEASAPRGPEVVYGSTDGLAQFYQKNGWLFVDDAKVIDGMVPVANLEPMDESIPAIDPENFNSENFNPLDYKVPLQETRPTYVDLGEAGVLFFYSIERLEVLYQRHLINTKAKQ